MCALSDRFERLLDTVRRRLPELDISPECKCPLEYSSNGRPLPCPHVLAAPDHELTIEQWGELLAQLSPFDTRDENCHGEPPPALAPRACYRRAARVAVMAQRHAAGLRLYDPGDYWPRTEEDDLMAVVAQRERNGETVDAGLQAQGGAA